MATKYQNYITGDDNSLNTDSTNWDGQTFTVSINHIITSVKLLMWRIGTPGTITVSIRATSSGLPTGADLCVGTTNGDTLPTSAGNAEWREITFSSGQLLLSGTKYAICIRSAAQWGNCRYDGSSPTYTDGGRVYSSDSGVAWTEPTEPSHDLMFEEWGDPSGSGGGGSIFPTDEVTRVSSIRHIYHPGSLRMEAGIGDLGFDVDYAIAELGRVIGAEAETPRPTPAPSANLLEQARTELAGLQAQPLFADEFAGMTAEEYMNRYMAGAAKYKCPYCAATFTNAAAMWRHIVEQHSDEHPGLEGI